MWDLRHPLGTARRMWGHACHRALHREMSRTPQRLRKEVRSQREHSLEAVRDFIAEIPQQGKRVFVRVRKGEVDHLHARVRLGIATRKCRLDRETWEPPCPAPGPGP